MPSKVGRNRIYSAEERRDRNRTAQAAFRDRRNKYTQGLEKALGLFESKIKELQKSEKHLIERAERAEQHCTQLESKVATLQKMVETIMADNLKLQSQCENNLSPNSSLSPSSSTISDFSASFMTNPGNPYLDQLPSYNTSILPINTIDILDCNSNNATLNNELIDPTNYFIPADSYLNLDIDFS